MATEVSGLGVAHDLTRVADRLQIAGDDFVERRSFRAGDLDDTVSWRRERHISNENGNVVWEAMIIFAVAESGRGACGLLIYANSRRNIQFRALNAPLPRR